MSDEKIYLNNVDRRYFLFELFMDFNLQSQKYIIYTYCYV